MLTVYHLCLPLLATLNRESESTYCLSGMNGACSRIQYIASLCAFGDFAVLLPSKVRKRRQKLKWFDDLDSTSRSCLVWLE